ncbi:MAG TPA: hypothetical protein VGD84_08335, partial [Pseudonocardiaceae bacterium]
AAPPTPASPTTVRRTDLRSLLTWPDLGYPGTENAVGPSKTGVVAGARASCEWASQQFNAGYTPPPSPSCNNTNDVAGSLSCVGDDAEELASIYNNSSFVIIVLAYLAGRPVPQPSRYLDHGHTVYLVDGGVRCNAETTWDGATLYLADGDASRTFGPPCDEVKKLVALLIQREPH